MLSTAGKITSQDLCFFSCVLFPCFGFALPLSDSLCMSSAPGRLSSCSPDQLVQLRSLRLLCQVRSFHRHLPQMVVVVAVVGGGRLLSRLSSTPSSWILPQVTQRLNTLLHLQLSGNHNKLTSFFWSSLPIHLWFRGFLGSGYIYLTWTGPLGQQLSRAFSVIALPDGWVHSLDVSGETSWDLSKVLWSTESYGRYSVKIKHSCFHHIDQMAASCLVQPVSNQ